MMQVLRPQRLAGFALLLGLLLLMVGGWFFMQSRDGLNKTLQHAAVWGMIFVWGIAAFGLWQDISSQTVGRGQIAVTGEGQIVVPQNRDGHYYLSALVNGATIRFVVDTGATDLVLTVVEILRAAGVVGKFVEFFVRKFAISRHNCNSVP